MSKVGWSTSVGDVFTRQLMSSDDIMFSAVEATTQTAAAAADEGLEQYIDNASRVSIYLVTAGVVGALSNAFVLYVVFLYTKISASLTGLLIINQTISDLTSGLLVAVQYAVLLANGPDVPFSGLGAEIYCRVWLTECILWGSIYVSTLNLVVVGVERYLAIVHPVFHKVHCGKKLFAPLAVFVWLGGMSFSMFWSIIYSYMDQEEGVCYLYDFGDDHAMSQGYGILTVILFYFLPLGCFCFCYGCMAYVIRFKGIQSQTAVKASKSLVRTLLFVTAAFVACWTANNIAWTLIVCDFANQFVLDMYYYATIVCYVSVFINPIIYAVQYREFKRGVRIMFNVVIRGRRVEPTTHTHTSVTGVQ